VYSAKPVLSKFWAFTHYTLIWYIYCNSRSLHLYITGAVRKN